MWNNFYADDYDYENDYGSGGGGVMIMVMKVATAILNVVILKPVSLQARIFSHVLHTRPFKFVMQLTIIYI
jgi:hypothetical protein